MTDNRTTELREAARSIQGNLGRCLYRRKDVDEMRKVSDLLFEAADTIESIGNGTLTAEQVREAVLENFEETYMTRYDHWEPSKFDWQAIADELNAELGSGTCGMIPSFTKPTVMTDCQEFCCSACGEYVVIQQFPGFVEEVPNYCPNCGRKVVER